MLDYINIYYKITIEYLLNRYIIKEREQYLEKLNQKVSSIINIKVIILYAFFELHSLLQK